MSFQPDPTRDRVPVIRIEEANGRDAIAEVAALFTDYQRTLGIDLGFEGFPEEVASLPGDYARPRGCLLLARSEGVAVGCVGLRPFAATIGEMKRLYVRESARRLGLGRRLAERVVREARAIGYARLYLDTLPSMDAAQELYRSLGFRDVPAYWQSPIAGTHYLGLDL